MKLDEKGGIVVDKHSKTSVDSIWSVGDVTNRIPLTPVARMEGMCLAHHLFGPKYALASLIPLCVQRSRPLQTLPYESMTWSSIEQACATRP